MFKGEENLITLNQTHSKSFHCTYLLQNYPFDTQVKLFTIMMISIIMKMLQNAQVCRVDLQLEQFDQDNVELVPDTMELLTDTELTQYYIKTWSLDYNDPGDNTFHNLQLSVRKKKFRFTIQRIEDGNSVQATSHQ